MSSTPDRTSKIQVVQALEKDDNESDRFVSMLSDQTQQTPQTPFQSIKAHPREFLWCLYAISVLVLASYDNQAGGSVISIPEFRKVFGKYYDGGYVLPAKWQSAYSGAPTLTSIIGSIGGGWLADKIGRKWTLAVGYVFIFVAITIETVALTNGVFLAGKLVAGLAIGTFSTTAITYLGEIAPLPLRGILTAASSMAFTFGPFIVSLVVKGSGELNNLWAFRSVFMSQYGFAIIGLVLLPLMPESPWWLLSKGKRPDAAISLVRLGYNVERAQQRISIINVALQQAKKETDGATYLECFRNTNLRRTIVAGAPLAIQALCGVYFVNSYSTYYQQLAGYNTSTTFSLGIIQQILSMLGNFCSWFMIDKVGRRPLSFYGMISLTVLLNVTGGLACVGSESATRGTVALLLLYNFFYNATIGATAYPILTETPTNRLRAKTASIALSLQNALFAMWAFVIPYLFNPDKANLGAKVAFIFGALAVLSTIYLWFCQPESSGRSFEEMDEMFTKRVPARSFKDYKTEKTQDIQLTVLDPGPSCC